MTHARCEQVGWCSPAGILNISSIIDGCKKWIQRFFCIFFMSLAFLSLYEIIYIQVNSIQEKLACLGWITNKKIIVLMEKNIKFKFSVSCLFNFFNFLFECKQLTCLNAFQVASNFSAWPGPDNVCCLRCRQRILQNLSAGSSVHQCDLPSE